MSDSSPERDDTADDDGLDGLLQALAASSLSEAAVPQVSHACDDGREHVEASDAVETVEPRTLAAQNRREPDDASVSADSPSESNVAAPPLVASASAPAATCPPLRPYQDAVLRKVRDRLRSCRAPVLLYMPTGAGKTRVAAELIHEYASSGRACVFVVNRLRLLDQAHATLLRRGIPEHAIGFIASTKPDSSDEEGVRVWLASMQTLIARAQPKGTRAGGDDRALGLVEAVWPRAELLILDEAHAAYAPTYQAFLRAYMCKEGGHASRCAHAHGGACTRVLGLTATPLRLNPSETLSTVFPSLVKGPSISALMREGVLCPLVVIDAQQRSTHRSAASLNKSEGWDRIVRLWMERARDRKTLAFAPDIAASRDIATAFEDAGVAAVHMDGSTAPGERDAAFNSFARGDITVLCSVGVLSEGFDEPSVAAIILARETASKTVYIQQVGRGTRCSPGKRDCIVLDCVGATLRHGPVTGPVGFEWEWHDQSTASAEAAWTCRSKTCRIVNHGSADRCAVCRASRYAAAAARPRGSDAVQTLTDTFAKLVVAASTAAPPVASSTSTVTAATSPSAAGSSILARPTFSIPRKTTAPPAAAAPASSSVSELTELPPAPRSAQERASSTSSSGALTSAAVAPVLSRDAAHRPEHADDKPGVAAVMHNRTDTRSKKPAARALAPLHPSRDAAANKP